MARRKRAQDRVIAKVYLDRELVIEADVSNLKFDQVAEWVEQLQERGCTVTFKRLPWSLPADETIELDCDDLEDEEEHPQPGKGVRE